jgi:spore coat protein CotH
MSRTTCARLLLLAPLALALVLALDRTPVEAAGNPAKDSDDFFAAKGEVISLTIDIDKTNLDSLRREPRKYVKATLTEGKTVYKDVGIHLKGAAGSWRGIDDKPGLTLNMNKFGGKELFHGMDKWHLANSVQDPSYLSELICGELYRAAGVPASRVSHALVTINGKKRGLYYLKEGYDKHFRKRHFADHHGNFYDGGFLREIDQPLQQLSGKGDVKVHTDLKALFDTTKVKKEDRFDKMAKLLDVDKFVSYLCLQVLTWDWDGYPMKRNNYRIYHEPKKDKIIFIPSGMDQMWGDPRGSLFPHFEGTVARAFLETPQGRKRYLERMEEILKKVYNSDAMVKRLTELEKRVQPALASVDREAGRQYAGQVKRLKDAIPVRAKSIEDQLKKAKK